MVGFQHPGGFGMMFLPPEVLKNGFMGKRSTHAVAAPEPEPTLEHLQELCSTPRAIAVLEVEARNAKEMEKEVTLLRSKEEELNRRILELERDMESQTAKHLSSMEILREEVRAKTGKSEMQISNDLSKGHLGIVGFLGTESIPEKGAIKGKRSVEDLPPLPKSQGFWQGLTRTFKARDLLPNVDSPGYAPDFDGLGTEVGTNPDSGRDSNLALGTVP
ncbi:unnamed protein product, partial [Choristocarpus tenellus]